jgi:hypothetical protein
MLRLNVEHVQFVANYYSFMQKELYATVYYYSAHGISPICMYCNFRCLAVIILISYI